jgi:hypothetical protein
MQWFSGFAKRASFVVQTVYDIWFECGLRIQSQITLADSINGVNHENRATFYSLFGFCPLAVGGHVLHAASAFDEYQSGKWQCQRAAERKFADKCQCCARRDYNSASRSRHG